jgi:hypothetical protein
MRMGLVVLVLKLWDRILIELKELKVMKRAEKGK